MPKKIKEIGRFRLSDLNCEVTQKFNVPGIWIPFPDNACIDVKEKDGKTIVDVFIEVIPTPNSQYSDKMIKSQLPKKYREENGIDFDSDQYKKLTPILGNLKIYEFEDKRASQQPQQSKPSVDDYDYLPPGLSGDGQWGGPINNNGWK